MDGLAELRDWFPWPAELPGAPHQCHGWFSSENQERLAELLGPRTRIVYEAGSYQGLSARFLAEQAPNATIICNDHWLGSLEHFLNPEARHDLPTLYETFLQNLWPFRERVVPMRTTIQDGLRILNHLKICPDLIYLDGSHDARSVEDDVGAILNYFPEAVLVGDDFLWETVRSGLQLALLRSPQWQVHDRGNCWWLERKAT